MDEITRKVRERVSLTKDRVDYTASTDFPGSYPGIDDSWNLEAIKKKLKIDVTRIEDSEYELEFDIIGLDAAIVNTIRRILIADTPTMAIESVYIFNNTSMLPDELFAHRLGLIPIKADPRHFTYRADDGGQPTDANTIVFNLKRVCTKKPNAPADATNPEDLYENAVIYSRDLEWAPQGQQEQVFGKNGFSVVYDDIVIMKMRPGQEVNMQLFCEKGVGKTHAKWSPVATASYRLMPEIILKEPIVGPLAHKLQKCFSPGVCDIVKNSKGEDEAKIVNPRADTVSREVFRHDDLRDKVELNRVRDHFIFSVESVGALAPDVLVLMALQELKSKCQRVIDFLDESAQVAAVNANLQDDSADAEA
ncbi:uncharacterized protein MONBRDRAFT_38678 [Monosiga brevicollis MX1]|uniref:DNA-directed RNA polymerases I and III subunit RPAC1 n=1 Tax=Monosiga brevicollis TaxID=81824 RepID=A9V9D0_MONBE|nr:uncharacterized protein MONBRDRAFT_38678 [Monosiga brevicollis MX1]EDQ85908.1 predicted protein [Monosiga brevicollis MX1]|eukprot:XP_001749387.1 hypothetical protein [Monosiga brevicollis MX1]